MHSDDQPRTGLTADLKTERVGSSRGCQIQVAQTVGVEVGATVDTVIANDPFSVCTTSDVEDQFTWLGYSIGCDADGARGCIDKHIPLPTDRFRCG